MTRKLMRRNEAAEYLGVSGRTLYRLVSTGKVPAYRWGREWRFDRAELDTWRRAGRENAAAVTSSATSPCAAGSEDVSLDDVMAEIRALQRTVRQLGQKIARPG